MTIGYDPTYDPANPAPEDVPVDPATGDPAYINSLVSQTTPAYPTEKILQLIRAARPAPTPVAPRAGFLDRFAAGLANVQSPGGAGRAGDVFGSNVLAGAARSFGGGRVAARDAALKAQMDEYTKTNAEKAAESQAGITGAITDYRTRAQIASEAAKTLAAHRYAKKEPTAQEKAAEAGLVTEAQQKARRKYPTSEAGAAAAVDSPLSDDAINALVQIKMQGGTDPTFGMGKAGVGNKVRYYNRLGQIAKGGGIDMGTRIASAKAERESLNKLTQTHTAASAYGDNVERNLKILEPTLTHIPDTGLTPLNALVRAGASKLGSRGMAAFNTARQIVVPEFARILNSPTLAGVISDNARKEMQTIIDPNATVGQIKRSIQILRQDKNNRLGAYADAIRQSQERIKALGVLPGATPASADQAFAPKPIPDEWKVKP